MLELFEHLQLNAHRILLICIIIFVLFNAEIPCTNKAMITLLFGNSVACSKESDVFQEKLFLIRCKLFVTLLRIKLTTKYENKNVSSFLLHEHLHTQNLSMGIPEHLQLKALLICLIWWLLN